MSVAAALKIAKSLNNGLSDRLALADNSPASNHIYLHKYFQSFSYFIYLCSCM
jgi:hypothetical protein